jgi:threonylcarbamoyladenosine tRNA methylthiotransferase MtaB
MMARFSVRFLGCKVSQADATLIRDALVDAGHQETDRERAEVHVVNTCALTVGAEKKSRKESRRAARGGATFVTGCAVNLNREQFVAPGITPVPASADRAAEEIVARLATVLPEGACADDGVRPRSRTRAFLKVQNGCEYRCTFCIIPTTRGPAESRPRDRIVRDARRRIAEGHPELVLTGINIGTWRDPDGHGLARLIREVGALDGLGRLRVSSIEPGDVDDDLLAALAETPAATPHLHVPLQSADPDVLAAMGRTYTVTEYRQAALRARESVPGLNLTTDAIIGFPGEDEEAFGRTCALVEELEMSKVHVFPYSPRPGTPAACMADAVPAEAKKERAARLRDVSDRLGMAHRMSRRGSEDTVLIEAVHDDGSRSGLAADYSRVVLPPGPEGPGAFVPVRIAGVAGVHLAGEVAVRA